MPELPEVEVLRLHLEPLMSGRTVRAVRVHCPRVVRPGTPEVLMGAIIGTTCQGIRRRGKHLLFDWRGTDGAVRITEGHLGMTGRFVIEPVTAPLRRHVTVELDLGGERCCLVDPRRFGRFALETESLDARLGPEPLGEEFTVGALAGALGQSRQAVKVRLMDQTVVAGLGNIYANEALHLAGVRPDRLCAELKRLELERLHLAIRTVLGEAVRRGAAADLDFSDGADGLFYFGSGGGGGGEERWRVYDRAGGECGRCGGRIVGIRMAGRSTFACEECQK
jgi:formamidopyrimidine-DNA glycosylase